MDKKPLINLLLVIAFLFLLFFILIFNTRLGALIYNFILSFKYKNTDNFAFLNVFWVGLCTIVAIIFSYFLAKKRKKNILLWVLLSIFINLWAPIILLFIKGHKKN